jgi:hypothetical protein
VQITWLRFFFFCFASERGRIATHARQTMMAGHRKGRRRKGPKKTARLGLLPHLDALCVLSHPPMVPRHSKWGIYGLDFASSLSLSLSLPILAEYCSFSSLGSARARPMSMFRIFGSSFPQMPTQTHTRGPSPPPHTPSRRCIIPHQPPTPTHTPLDKRHNTRIYFPLLSLLHFMPTRQECP